MNSFGNTKSKSITPGNILGGIIGAYEEESYERETSTASTIVHEVGGFFGAAISLVQEAAKGESESKTAKPAKFSSGSFSNFKENQTQQAQIDQLKKQQAQELQERAKIDQKKAFYQALKEGQEKVQREKDKVFEEEINDIVSNLPTEQKNRLLHYQASYKDKSVYQRAELRRKLIEEQRRTEQQQKEASIPSPAKQPSAMEGAFEGRSGSQGSGTANLSAMATG